MRQRHLLGISGGKDSAALAVYMKNQHPEIDVEYFFTDTGKELPEVYEFLGRLESYLGKKIHLLNPVKDFDFYLKLYNNFLPSPQTRWCTRMLKLAPLKKWISEMRANGEEVYSYVAIRADEEYRTAMQSSDESVHVVLPFREDGIDKAGVYEILETAGIGLPSYYEWRSRSGCTFCFFQQKIEWVHLLEHHPDKFKEAMLYEKDALQQGSPFTWSQGESLKELSSPKRIIEIKKDYEERRKKAALRRKNKNPLQQGLDEFLDNDDIYGEDEGNGACSICMK
ncbi:phosphoadenosine phosphosulfate reductase family protein [Parasutterella excrementihominis]|jgi:hypothetical protein|uniref:phosphoadenosine phosphosulfate reductase family protein n=1 Tax=Parasutterella excrementihominis TaxID=487175 RepID=UPI00242F632E|nr:phosphoadenosine phosphosulfate reductase family protein [Parasutterella excrementihominis]